MKRSLVMGVNVLFVVGMLTLPSHGQQRVELRDFMRAKLTHAQKALEGLVLNELDRVQKAAQDMKAQSLDESWRVLQTEQYLLFSRQFRTETEALSEAARTNNLDKATAAYGRLTARCVECHKYVRDVKMAKVGE